MIRMISRVAAAIVLFCANMAYADNATTGKLLRIGTGLPGTEGLYLTIDQPTNPVCPSGMIFMPYTALQYKETFSTALLALSQGKAITVYYGTTCTSGGHIALDAISISP